MNQGLRVLERLANRFSYLFLLRACWRLGERRQLAVLFMLVLVVTGLDTIEPFLQGKFVAALTRGGDRMMHDLLFWLSVILAVSLVSGMTLRRSRLLQSDYAFKMRTLFLEQLYRKVVDLPWQWHGKQHSGTTTAKVNDASSALYQFADIVLFSGQIIFGLAGYILALTLLAPAVGLTVAISAWGITVLFRKSNKGIVARERESVKAEQFLSTGLIDYLGNIGTLISLRLQRQSESEILRRLGLMRETFGTLQRVSANKDFFQAFVQQVFRFGVILLYVVVNRKAETATLVGSAVAILSYLTSIQIVTYQLGWLQQAVMRNRAQLATIDDIETAHRQYAAAPPPDGKEWHRAEIRDVGFNYEDRERHVHQLAGIALTLARGKRIALVGSSGSGKSTLLRLLRGLHEPASGTLTVDGAEIGFPALAAVSTLIPQDAEIFENTLRYNVAFGVEASDAELRPIIDMACLTAVIEPLPEKLDTDIRERGVNLSGGQKQRLALARGLFAARHSSLLLMDEPTSSLDPVTEADVFTRIFAGLPNTCIVAAIHRLHLLDRFDHIYVLEDGRVVEQGALSDLLTRGGALAGLWAAQKRKEGEISRP